MLSRLNIKNIALISNAEIDFKSGLNVLSGETGSGKSVILESINFVLGAKADKSLIRSGETECFVEAEFDLKNCSQIKQVFDETGIEFDETLIINRKFTIDGKSTIRINGETANVSMLKKFTSLLVDVHGQSEHFSLLNKTNQLKLIDKFGGENIDSIKNKIQDVYFEHKNIVNQLNKLGGDEATRLLRLDILNYQIKEITEADIKENEFEELTEIRKKLQFTEKIANALNFIKDSFNTEGGALDIIREQVKNSANISDISSDFASINDRLNNVFSECQDIESTVSNLLDSQEESNYSLDYVEDRLDKIKTIYKKYCNDCNLDEFLLKAKEEKNNIENFNEIANDLLIKKEKIEKDLYNLYNELSVIRRKFAKEFSSNVLNELTSLGMPNANFSVNFNNIPDLPQCKFDSPNGFDDLDFYFSANLGEPVKSLSEIISGGEMSRFMLAIKAQNSVYNDISTYIFDEIDAGISGIIANVVAEKFIKISTNVQVIAISHLPQISAIADNNLLIYKEEENSKTYTRIKQLSKDDKIKEILRLIGGDINSESALNHAKDLIEKSDQYKNNLKKNR